MSLLVVLGVGGYRVADGAITIASLVTFVMFLFFLVGPLGSFFGAITSVNQALGALGRIQEVIDLPVESDDDAAIAARVTADAAPAAADAGAAIAFRDVHFAYPSAGRVSLASLEEVAQLDDRPDDEMDGSEGPARDEPQ